MALLTFAKLGATQEWIPYPTEAHPLNYPDLPLWDGISIAGVILPIDPMKVPHYVRELDADAKAGPKQDYWSTTDKGIKPSDITITLRLWIDYRYPAKGQNYLDAYDKLIDKILAPKIDRRFAVPVYYPTLRRFGVTSVIFTQVPTPEHNGGGMWGATLVGIDGRTRVKSGTASGAKKIVKADQYLDKTANNRATSTGTGPQASAALTSQINTPASRSRAP